MLLGISVLSIFVARTGLVPSSIPALGIDLLQANQHDLLFIMAVVVGYFEVGFFLYGLTDFLSWQLVYNEGSEEALHKIFKRIYTEGKLKEESFCPEEFITRWPNRMALYASFARALFEFLVPIVVGSYAIYALLASIPKA
jgi:hypothetical protein